MTAISTHEKHRQGDHGDDELSLALLKARLGVHLLTMTATTNLLDSAQQAVRQTVAPPLAVSLAKVRDPGSPPNLYRPGVTVMFLHKDDPLGQRSATIEVSTCTRGGRVVPAYILHLEDKAGPLYADASAALSAAIEWVRGSESS